jgi:hypothetical protein
MPILPEFLRQISAADDKIRKKTTEIHGGFVTNPLFFPIKFIQKFGD